MLINLFLYIASFFLIWKGSGLIVGSMDRFSKKLRLSSFAVSFLILGNGINLKQDLDKFSLLACLGVILAPAVLLVNKRLSMPEGMILIILYFVLVVLIENRHGIFARNNSEILNIKAYSYKDFLKMLLGAALVFIASQLIVDNTIYFSRVLNIHEFYLSLIILSLGTNLPELSLAIRSVVKGNKKDIAFGDYMGSAASNTLLFGVFTLLNGGEVLTVNNFVPRLFVIIIALLLFYFFSQSKNNISRKEGIVLFGFYWVFVLFEIFR